MIFRRLRAVQLGVFSRVKEIDDLPPARERRPMNARDNRKVIWKFGK
jgi:hypothetical protein